MNSPAHTGARSIPARPLTSESFAPYGEVIEHAGSERRHFVASAFDHSRQVSANRFWVSQVDAQGQSPLLISALERHPYSAQTFIPLTHTSYLVVVAPSLVDGQPDAHALEAFIASPAQGVCYGRGVWHHGLTVLQAPAQFAVFMGMAEHGNDQFLDLPVSSRVLVHYA